jgi:hypothetical protein
MARHHRKARGRWCTRRCAVTLTWMLIATPVQACPVCDTERATALRRALFGETFVRNTTYTLLPFPVLGAFVSLIHLWTSRSSRADSRDRL